MYRSPEGWEKLIGERVRKERLKLNMTQAEMASRAGISMPSVSRLECGKGSSLATFIKVLQVLGDDGWLETLAPESSFSPIRQHTTGKQRKRATARG